MFKRARHQFGWLEKRKRKRGPEVWVWRYHADVRGSAGTKPAIVVGDVSKIRRNQRHGKLLRLFVWQSVIQSNQIS